MTDEGFDIIAILEHYGWELRGPRVGWYSTRCYEHDDAHASATINVEVGAVKCMACDFKGNAVSIVAQKEGLNYRDAISRAKELSGTSNSNLYRSPTASPRVSGRQGHNRGDRPYLPPRLRGSDAGSIRG